MPKIEIREAVPSDAGALLGLIKDLAAYERQPDAVAATEADLLRDGFGTERRFEAVLAAVDGRAAGFALFFPNYSTWEGRAGLYLEDLFVAEWARRYGVGRRLIACLAAIAVRRGWTRLDLSVLDWNPARGFYERLGFAYRQEWLPYRLDRAALRRLAAEHD
ncbi:MAG TPA: GNAT family N-acetyltransferase [Stellaceae bacterium]|nr:GNAT family N-acetyltransferase [Stellaceae bacterium]